MQDTNDVKDRRHKIIQLLQRNSLSTNELVNRLESEFNIIISDRTIQNDIRYIEDVMNINLIREHNKYSVPRDQYLVTVHDFNVQLNLSEVYILLVDTYRNVKNSQFKAPIYKSILQKFYNQLSQYAKNIIDKNNVVRYSDNDNSGFTTEKEMMNEYHNFELLMSEKAGKRLDITFLYNGEEITKMVTVRFIDNDNIELKEGSEYTYRIKVSDIVVINEIEDFN